LPLVQRNAVDPNPWFWKLVAAGVANVIKLDARTVERGNKADARVFKIPFTLPQVIRILLSVTIVSWLNPSYLLSIFPP